MGSLASTAVLLFVILALVGMGAFVFALTFARIIRQREEKVSAQQRRRQRPWGGRDYARFRSKYFEKELRARAVRAQYRPPSPPPGSAPPDRDAPPAPPSDLERAHRETLELPAGALTPEDVRTAYVQRMREYHPDRVTGLGVKIRQLAEEETKRINEAYRFFRQQLGF